MILLLPKEGMWMEVPSENFSIMDNLSTCIEENEKKLRSSKYSIKRLGGFKKRSISKFSQKQSGKVIGYINNTTL